MAIVQNPLIARTSGSVGNSVFSKWKRKNTLRSKSINPYPAPSPSQQLNRDIFAAAIVMANQIKPYFTYFYRGKSLKKSVYNIILSNIISCFDPLTLKLDTQKISKIILSAGTLPASSSWQLQDAFDQFYCWASVPPIERTPDDDVFSVCVLYSEDLGQFKCVSRTLSEGPYMITGLLKPTSGLLRTHVFCVTCSSDGLLSSPSFYVGYENIDINLVI